MQLTHFSTLFKGRMEIWQIIFEVEIHFGETKIEK